MLDANEYIRNSIILCCNAARQGTYIKNIPFTEVCNGYVYDDSVVRIACSEHGEFIEVFRKYSETIVFELANAVLRRYSPEFDLLIPHIESLLTHI